MLATVLRVLRAVHEGAFAARAAPPSRGPDGRLIRRGWDVRHVLHEHRMQVGALPPCMHGLS